MENRKLIKFLILALISGFFVFNNNAFAYDIETHAFLTDETVKFYNQNFSDNKIPEELKGYLIDGSRREDEIPRWMNHFYDPVYNRGLTNSVLETWQKSKDWAQDSNNQNSLTYKVPTAIASVLTAIQEMKISALTTETDFTWQRAIRFYVNGEKEKGMFMLGHILHLIEDTSVPDHTRNDLHPIKNYYEKYTKQFNLSNPDKNLVTRTITKNPIILDNLDPYFDTLAKFSNNNYYSGDTIGIQSGYNLPVPDDYEKISDILFARKMDSDGFYTLSAQPIQSSILIGVKGEITIDNNKVLSDYWSRLSTKSIQHGAGVINLFFQEAEKAKNDPNFVKAEDKSIFAKAIEATKNLFAQVGGFFLGLVGADQNFQPAGQIALDQSQEIEPSQTNNQSQEAEPQQTEIPKTNKPTQPVKSEQTSQQQTEQQTTQQQEQESQYQEEQQNQQQEQPEQVLGQATAVVENFKQCSFVTTQAPSHQKVIINEVAWMGTTNSANDEWIELKNISNSEVNLNGWQLIDQGEQIKINLGLIKETKIKAGQFILLERTDDNTVPNVSADFIYTGALSNSDEGLRLFDSQCNLIDEVLANPDWPAGDNTSAAERKTMERDASGFSWHTSNIVGGTPKKENSAPTVIYSGGGGGGTPTNNQQPTTNNSQPATILISEIQITNGPGKTENDFIELYNPNDFQVNLNGYRLIKRTKTGTTDTSIKSWTTDIFIPANGYYLWANSGYTDIPVTPDITTTATISNDNGVAIRFGAADTGTIIDSVAWGEAQNAFIEGSVFSTNPGVNQSIQRKFQNNTFIDTDNNASDFEIQTCPSPKAQSKNCSATNQAPGAFFVYTPQNPTAGDLITFNAASSTDSDGQIISYQWDFGDNATLSVSTATTTHTYSQAGNYQVSLIVFDNQNASSTATSTIISVASIGANHLVISEILFDAQGSDVGKEFVELYNPTNNDISLANYSLRILTGNATSTTSLIKFGSKPEDTTLIKSKSFLLVGLNNYTGNPQADAIRTASLPNSSSTIYLSDNNDTEIDAVSYSVVSVEGQGLERRAWQNNSCVSAQGIGEFLGNGCDTDNAADFEIRDIHNPQNSQSLPEPRSAPAAVQNFNIAYSSSSLELIFDWQESQDYSGVTSTIVYEIQEYSSPGAIIFRATSTAEFRKRINEIGRNYDFSIQAFDEDGLGSVLVTSTTSVPSFFSSSYFYQDPRNNIDYLIESYYKQYPFVPDLFGQDSWKLLIFYLNSEAGKQNDIYNSWQPNNLENVLRIRYKHCSSGSLQEENSVIFPDISSRCGNSGGAYSQALDFRELEDNHLVLQTIDLYSDPRFDAGSPELNYFTVAFYATQSTMPFDGRVPYFRLVAVDKTKYYFDNPPTHQPPQLSGKITLNFDQQNSRLNIDWPKATDPDTLDSFLTYEIQYTSSTDWGSVGNVTGTARIVAPGDNFSISVRAKDDFDNYSEPLPAVQWSYPEITFYITQTEIGGWSDYFGQMDWNANKGVSLQSITPETDFQFNKIVLRIKRIQDTGFGANFKLSVFNNKVENNQDRPDFTNLIANSAISDIWGNPENQDITFNFNTPVSVNAANKYWLALEVESYSWDSYYAWTTNSWANALAENNPYALGEAGKTIVRNSIYKDSISIGSNADWYMKIGLE